MNLVTQREDDGCMRACLAMIAGCDYDAVPEAVKHSLTEAVCWLESKGYDAVALKTNYTPRQGCVYLVCAPSLNIMSTLHEVVMDCTTEPHRLFDPRDGCEGKVSYTLESLYRRNQFRVEFEIRSRRNSQESNPKRGSPPFPEAEAAGGGGNSPDVSNAHSANPVGEKT